MTHSVMPVRRNLNFHLPAERISDWHSGNVHITHFLNARSFFFPVGERFLLARGRPYRDKVPDTPLRAPVKAVVGEGEQAWGGGGVQRYRRAGGRW